MNNLAKRRLDLFGPRNSLFESLFDRQGLLDWALEWPDWNWASTNIVSDLNENEHSFMVKAEVPGTKETDVKVEYNNNTLTITSETKKESDDSQSHYRERYYGTSRRSYYMPNVDENQIIASLKDGVLTVTCPKLVNGGERKQIPIKTE